jgi:hypothetical protein
MPTKEESIRAAGRAYANGLRTQAQMTPREQAEGAWTPTYRGTVEDLEDLIRADRGMEQLDRGGNS